MFWMGQACDPVGQVVSSGCHAGSCVQRRGTVGRCRLGQEKLLVVGQWEGWEGARGWGCTGGQLERCGPGLAWLGLREEGTGGVRVGRLVKGAVLGPEEGQSKVWGVIWCQAEGMQVQASLRYSWAEMVGPGQKGLVSGKHDW